MDPVRYYSPEFRVMGSCSAGILNSKEYFSFTFVFFLDFEIENLSCYVIELNKLFNFFALFVFVFREVNLHMLLLSTRGRGCIVDERSMLHSRRVFSHSALIFFKKVSERYDCHKIFLVL